MYASTKCKCRLRDANTLNSVVTRRPRDKHCNFSLLRIYLALSHTWWALKMNAFRDLGWVCFLSLYALKSLWNFYCVHNYLSASLLNKIKREIWMHKVPQQFISSDGWTPYAGVFIFDWSVEQFWLDWPEEWKESWLSPSNQLSLLPNTSSFTLNALF